MQLDGVDRRLLNLTQTEFPLVREPYLQLAGRLGVDEREVIRRIASLKEDRVIRMIGPVLDSRSLGYSTTLVAMKVTGEHLEKAEQVIAAHPSVSHGYERDHEFNVWFTLAVAPTTGIDIELEKLARSAHANVAYSMPALRVFKIGAFFDMGDEGLKTPGNGQHSPSGKKVDLSPAEKGVINHLQQDLPLTVTPFDAMAEQAGIDVDEFLTTCRSLQEKGVIRRFSASINHRSAGFTANGMACWAARPEDIEAAGRKLASLKEVSHCYERKTNPLWHHNLFAMIHCRSREACQEIVDGVSRETGLDDAIVLYSTREFKKARVKYQL